MKEKEVVTALIFVLLAYSAIFTFSNSSITAITANIIGEKNTVSITADGFEPAEIAVSPGESVTWVNDYKETHVLFSPKLEERFTTPEISPDTTYTHVYTHIGEFKYYEVNWGFKGAVIVNESGTGKEEAKETGSGCAECSAGCIREEADCSRCSCPCYDDEDCDDSDESTLDICSSFPVKCTHTGIVMNKQNISSNAAPVQAYAGRQENSALFIGGFLALAAIILAFFVLRPTRNRNPSKT